MSRVLSRIAVLASAVMLCLIMPMSFNVSADNSGSFYLGDVSVGSNRLFEVTLYADNIENVASFIVHISYDESVIEYRDTRSEINDATFSVNDGCNRDITAVFLKGDSVSCSDKTPLMIFKFKSLKAGESVLSLEIEDAIDKNGTDISEFSAYSATVSVSTSGSVSLKSTKSGNGSSKDNTNSSKTQPDTSVGTENEDMTYLSVKGRAYNTELIISLVVFCALIMAVAVFCAYKLSKKNGHRSGEKIPLEYKNDKKSVNSKGEE